MSVYGVPACDLGRSLGRFPGRFLLRSFRGRWACSRPASRAGPARASWAAVADLGRICGRGCRWSVFSMCFSTGPGVSCGLNGAGCVGSGFGAIWPGAPGRLGGVSGAILPPRIFSGTLLPLKISLLNYFSFFSGGILLPGASTFSKRLFFPPRPPPLPMRNILPTSAKRSNAGRTQLQHILRCRRRLSSVLRVGTGTGNGIGNGNRNRQHCHAAPE